MISPRLRLRSGPLAYATSSPEAKRRLVVRAVFFVFLLSLIEGPLRKWFLPNLAGPITLLRDPFVLALYAYCFANGLIWTRGFAQVWLGFAAIVSIFGLVQYGIAGHSAAGWVLGVRTYWLYMPLAFVVAKSFEPKDVQSFIRMVMLIAIPYSSLMAMQYSASSLAFVNLGVGGDTEGAVRVTSDIFRPFGLFTHSGPNLQYTVFTVAAFVAFYTSDDIMRHRRLFLLAAGVAVGAMSVLTGSRSIYYFCALILLLTALGILRARPTPRTLLTLLGLVFFVTLAGLLLTTMFPDMLVAMSTRFEQARLHEGRPIDRVLSTVFGWTGAFWQAPIFGHGIGTGASGVSQYLGLPNLIYGEDDLIRNMNELGIIFGSIFVMLRWGTVIWILIQADRLAQRGALYALPLAGFAVAAFGFGSITHSTLNAMLPWLALGMLANGARFRNKPDHDLLPARTRTNYGKQARSKKF